MHRHTVRPNLPYWPLLLALPLAVAYALAGWPLGLLVVLGSLLPWLRLMLWATRSRHFIDWPIHWSFVGYQQWPVHTKTFPLYKFVDLYRAAHAFAATQPNVLTIVSQHDEPLSRILNGLFSSDAARTRKVPVMIPRKVDYDQEEFVPADTFWLLRPDPAAAHGAAIVRVRFLTYSQEVQVEIAAALAGSASTMMDEIIARAAAHSIYRNRMISVAFEPEIRDRYGDVESSERFDILFHRQPPINDSDIILDERINAVLERTIVDFHNRRAELMALGLPGKRGILFYGPPGTGKTYTCKYLAQRLESVTTIVATGPALAHITSICNVAKLLQPSLVLLEDVDLVFSDRQINPYSTILGEFMDQLDGFGDADQVIFVLTTNAIERIEAAIKDRPGRISQCIYFGAPNADLRARYLRAHLQPYDYAAVNLGWVLERTEGASQAYLKELVFRAVQIATERKRADGQQVCLRDRDLEEALNEMTAAGGRSAKRIIGFQVDVER